MILYIMLALSLALVAFLLWSCMRIAAQSDNEGDNNDLPRL